MLIRHQILVMALLGSFVLWGCDFFDDEAETETGALTISKLENIVVRTVFDSDTPKLYKAMELTMDCANSGNVDQPGVFAGLDCDTNGGEVAYQTPTYLGIAFKGLYLVPVGVSAELANTGLMIPILEDNATLIPDVSLADGDVIEFASPSNEISLPIPSDAANYSPSAEISGIFAIIYYYDLEIKMYGETRILRVYMSSDETPRDGGTHHQGDITHFYSIDTDTYSATNPERWAYGGNNWFYDLAGDSLSRGIFANGVGGTDPQTGLDRGMFGDATFWNRSDLMQGPNQDDYFEYLPLDENEGINIEITFSIVNSWYYENFVDTSGDDSIARYFDPCYDSSYEGCGASWAITPPDISVEVTE